MSLISGNSETTESENGQSDDTTTTETTTTTAPSWRDSLDAELKDTASLANFTDINALAKSYVNATSMLGKDKIVVPNQHTTDDDWKEIWSKLGMPDAESYAVEGTSAEEMKLSLS